MIASKPGKLVRNSYKLDTMYSSSLNLQYMLSLQSMSFDFLVPLLFIIDLYTLLYWVLTCYMYLPHQLTPMNWGIYLLLKRMSFTYSLERFTAVTIYMLCWTGPLMGLRGSTTILIMDSLMANSRMALNFLLISLMFFSSRPWMICE